MNNKIKFLGPLISAAVLCFCPAHAGTITGVDGIVGSGLGDVQNLLLFTNQANNDNSPNAGGINAVGYDEVIFDQVGEIDIVFNVADSGGVTEYSAIFSVFNFTADTWDGIEFELGFGSGDTFQPVAKGTGLDFDTPDRDPMPVSNLFSAVTHTENSLSFDNGSMPFGFVDALFFAIDVPDGVTQITLRQTPVRQPVTLEVPTDFPTIQAAVDAAQPGDTVFVLAGTYAERVVITKSDLILSTTSDTAVIDGTNVVDQPPIGGNPGDPVVAGAGIGIHVLGTAAQPVSNIAIEDFVVHGFERGIVLENVQFSRVEGAETFNNVDKGVCCEPGTTQADGITLLGSSFNQITGNIADDNGHDGIFVRNGSSGNEILGNVTRGNGVMFLPPEDPRSVSPADGSLLGCGIQIGIDANQNNVVEGNKITDGHWGVQLGPDGDNAFNLIRGNTIHNNSLAAVAMFESAHDNIIERNDGTGNGLENIIPSLEFDLFDAGELNNSWVNNRGTSNFSPGSGLPCADIARFRARCQADGTIQTRVDLRNASHNAETVTIAIDGAQQALTIAGARADSLIPGFSGLHTVSLDDPAMCQADVIVDCPDGQETLTLMLAGAGSGRVTSVPAGIDCGASCAAVYDTGTIVTLTATPDTGSVFAGFGGNADCSDGSVTMSTAVNCTASFELEGGVGIPCADIKHFRARCLADGTIQTRVDLRNASHNAETVAIAIDGARQVLPIAGARADSLIPGFSGLHTVSLVDPVMCQADVPVSCP